ncbi:DUF4245 domain-containing protein [Granulicoccus sp. GXG6511]|uniref:DUF4245 domain-containing protein n=1 Tax=Granulicoccus sp. GXG6511 TaxID=3381351 RepID=UPI003D7EC867
MADKQRKATAADMLRSLAVIMIPILLLTWLLTNNLDDYPVERVDWRPVADVARAEVDWPLWAPEGLPEEGRDPWVPSRVSWLRTGDATVGGGASPRNHWRLGYLSPDKMYYEINQGDDRLDQFVREVTREGTRVGAEPIEGREWERWESRDGRTQSLVLRDEHTATLVTSDAEFIDLQQFARTLRAS